jgi:hypothetical protein
MIWPRGTCRFDFGEGQGSEHGPSGPETDVGNDADNDDQGDLPRHEATPPPVRVREWMQRLITRVDSEIHHARCVHPSVVEAGITSDI